MAVEFHFRLADMLTPEPLPWTLHDCASASTFPGATDTSIYQKFRKLASELRRHRYSQRSRLLGRRSEGVVRFLFPIKTESFSQR